MDKFRIIIILVILVVLLIIGVFFFGNIRNIPFISKQSTVIVAGHTFIVEVAQTATQKEKGLSGRSSLAADHGMYFPFDTPGFYAFWMKDMKFPLDIVYISRGKVIAVYRNVAPKPNPYNTVVKPNQPADSVLEINAGIAQKDGITNGSTVTTNL